jgi:D-alanyl-lipoteichoic acid acyltransferase DltB (MBOAT superfamily)
VKLPRWSLNILIVFMISGLWHGASWTFVVWGALHGLMILAERYTSKIFNFKIQEGWNALNVLLVLKTFIITSFIWIFFRAENFQQAKNVIKAMLRNWNVPAVDVSVLTALIFSIALIVIDMLLYNSRIDKRLDAAKVPVRWAVYAVLIFCLMALSGTQKFTFIYFQF